MRSLILTKLQKKKLKEVILYLFPKYKYVNINKDGIISLRKSFWWYIFNVSIKYDITEMCLVQIPERLEKLKSKSDEYENVFPIHSHIILDFFHLRKPDLVINYIYDAFIKAKYGIIKTYCITHNILPEKRYTLFSSEALVLSPLSPSYIKSQLSKWKNVTSNQLPALRKNYLNMWFKKEIKEQLNMLYNIKMRIALSF